MARKRLVRFHPARRTLKKGVHMNFTSIIGLVLSVGLLVIEFIEDKQGGESEKEYKYISAITTGIYILYMIGDSLFAEGIIADRKSTRLNSSHS